MNDDDVEVQVSQVKQVRDDASIVTEDHTFDDTTSNVAQVGMVATAISVQTTCEYVCLCIHLVIM